MALHEAYPRRVGGWSRRRFLGAAAAAAGVGTGAAACSGSGTSAPAAKVVPITVSSSGAASASPSSPTDTGSGSVDPQLIAQRYSGLKPFPDAPTPPAVKPVDLNVAQPQDAVGGRMLRPDVEDHVLGGQTRADTRRALD